jgi:hypothetical protein
MPKFIAELNNDNIVEFKTKEEWEEYISHKISKQKKYYDPQPRNLNPQRFPCLMIYDDAMINSNPYGNDEFANFFVYDYTTHFMEDEW